MKLIPLTKGHFAQVDDEDYDNLMQWKWRIDGSGYASRIITVGYFNGKRKQRGVSMHRLINQTPDGVSTDHRDGNKLNNQKYNLRDATCSQNFMNKPSCRGQSRFKGVSPHRGKWRSTIKINEKQAFLGCFNSETEAARAYNAAAIEHFGEFASLNIIPDFSGRPAKR